MRVLLMTGEEKDSSSFYDSGNQAVTGVLIAAEGADNSVVSRNIVEGVMALFHFTSPHFIFITLILWASS